MFQWHISMRHKQTEEHKISHVWSKSIFKVTLRVENIGQKYSIYITSIKFWKILQCEMFKGQKQDFSEKHY